MSQEKENMNYDEYKKAFATDRNFEQEMAKAMTIEVPELTMPKLPDIADGKVVALDSRRRFQKTTWLAAAAAIVLAVFVGTRLDDFGHGQVTATLEEQVLAHLDGEPGSVRVTDTPVTDSKLALVVAANVATMNHDVGLITYAKSCSINGHDVPHLVIQSEQGPVTILLMPEETIPEATTLDGKNIRGVIIPVGDGSIAIISDKNVPIDRIKQNVLNSVNWST